MLCKSQMRDECFQAADFYNLKGPILKLWLIYELEKCYICMYESDSGSISLQSITLPSTTNYKSIDEMLRVYLATAETWSGEK